MDEQLTLENAIELFLNHRKAKNVTSGTLRSYCRWLYGWLSWRTEHGYGSLLSEVTLSEILSFFLYLQEDHIPHQNNPNRPTQYGKHLDAESINSCYRTLRAFWRFLAGDEKLDRKQEHFFARDRIPRPKICQEIRETYSKDAVALLLEACAHKEPEVQYRNEAILLILVESGMRIAELCSLTDGHTDLNARRAKIKGKGGTWRFVYWHEATERVLRLYLHHRRGNKGGPLFRGVSAQNDGNALTPDSVRSWFKRLAKQAGVAVPVGSPIHSFRHTFAHEALNSGIDIAHISQLLGHKSLEVTMRYVRENPDVLQQIHERIRR